MRVAFVCTECRDARTDLRIERLNVLRHNSRSKRFMLVNTLDQHPTAGKVSLPVGACKSRVVQQIPFTVHSSVVLE